MKEELKVNAAATGSSATVQLPSWTDPAAVTSYITTLVGITFAVLTALHPGYTEPTIVQAILPSVGAIVAGVAQIVNVITHRNAVAKIAAAAISR